MKRVNGLFLGECAIVLSLLVLIGILIRDDKAVVSGREQASAVVEVEDSVEEVAEQQQFLTEGENKEEAIAIPASVNETDIIQREVVAEEQSQYKDVADVIEEVNQVKIVVFGDSIWNAGRGIDGISEQVMEQLDVKIYNCSIGGTTAAVDGESTKHDEWTSRSFNGMMYIANGIVDARELIAEDAAYEVITEVDFEEVDYVIVSYGLNDYFSDIPVYPKDYYDLTSYVGALRHGIKKLQKNYPDLEVILTSPTYCGWFQGERQYELGTYVEAARSVAQEMDVHFLDMYHALGDSPDEKTEYLSDGVHLTKEGRTLYANSVIEFLKQIEIEK